MSQRAEERRRQVLSYLKHQSQKSIAEMQALVQEEWDRVGVLMEGLSQAQAAYTPGPDEWSIAHVVRHLTLSAQRGRERIGALALGQAIQIPTQPGMLPSEEGAPFTQVAQLFREATGALQELVEGLEPAANLDMTSEHSFFGPLNWREWFVFQRLHGHDHTQQVEAIRASPGFPSA